MYSVLPLLRLSRILMTFTLLAVVVAATGCGDGNSTFASTPNPTPNPTASPTPTPIASSTVQLRVGDAPADQMLSFEVTLVSPIIARLSDGTKIEAALANNRIELSHSAGKLEALGTITLPQGTYQSVNITIADPAVTYVYTPLRRSGASGFGGPELVSRDFPGTQTVTLAFDPPIKIGADASVVNLDVNIANSLIFNPDDSQEIIDVRFTPASFALIQKPIAAPEKQQHMNGELESVWGVVTALSGNNSLILKGGQSGVQLQIGITSTTQFHDSLKGLSDTLGRLIEVEGYTQANGTMVATEIEPLAGSNGAGIEGVILDAGNSLIDRNVLNFGHQADAFTMLAQDGTGNGAKNDDLGWTFTIHTQYLTDQAYALDYGKCDWSGLNTDVPGPLFPFDSRHLFPGQRVAVVTSSALPDSDFTHFTATKVELEQQAVTGRIVFYHSPDAVESLGMPETGTWFVLALPQDSYVRALSGREFVLVYQGPSVDIEYLPSNTDKTIGEGALVRVRGMMFAFADWFPKGAPEMVSHDGGTLTMIARRITEQQQERPVPQTAAN